MNQADSDLRFDRIESELAIRALAARYCFAIDDHDLDAVGDLFTNDARVWSRDGMMDAQGRAAIVEQYRGRFAVLGPSNHVSHDHWIRFDGDPDIALGLLSAHAELYRNETPMVAALRYTDTYRREHRLWRIADRQLAFLYYVPLAEYPGILGVKDRVRAYATPTLADYPESLPGWRDYRP